MPRTTLDLDHEVLRELKARRAIEGKPLGVIASELLVQALHAEVAPAEDLAWQAGSLGAKVDLDDKDALWAVLDGS